MSPVPSQGKEKLEYRRELEQATPNFPECVLGILHFLTLIVSKKGFEGQDKHSGQCPVESEGAYMTDVFTAYWLLARQYD